MTASTPTLAALLTPLAPGPIAVLALAGPQTDAILRSILRRPGADGPPEIADDRPTFCRLVDDGEVLDDVVVVKTCRGGVPAAEINTHGGVRIAQRTLLLLEKCGATITGAEDFVGRFTAAGPVEQDVDRTLLRVSSRRLACWLLGQRRVLPAFLDRLDSLSPDQRTACQQRSRIAIRLLQGLQVALIGPPNAGKSTLANRLIGTRRVITSRRAGTTRDWVAETALIRGWPITLTDTAGVRDTECQVEAEAIRRAGHRARSADLIIVVLDATTPPETRREELKTLNRTLNRTHNRTLSRAIPPDRPRIVVLNKCDVENADCGLRIADWAAEQPGSGLPISALTGAGLEALESQIESTFGLDRLDDTLPTPFLPHQLAPWA
jgi:tRNA modification GTPase